MSFSFLVYNNTKQEKAWPIKEMKADISIPNPLYEAATQLAQQLDMSLSEFFLAALTDYIDHYQRDDVTMQLNQVYETEDSTLDPGLAHLQTASLGHETW